MSLGTAHENIITSLLDLLHSLQYNSITRIQTALIYGPKGRIDGWMDGWMDGWILVQKRLADRWTDSWTDACTVDRQTNK